ncbi:sensor histidine kinase [Ramlibacter rhizophilus]|uniref:histidine kinase n=1 Tax=Ramlibacter rhizophilus TaxID=1781167 RepID=A0A4Z0BJS5_9BURK|nr:HAMP domain-containing sensor histidine kinase [Ramlibacter rhizophilus]TFY99565.1 HAMP domain-containing histidine kinase [Ramlibacter rhizophilus]
MTLPEPPDCTRCADSAARLAQAEAAVRARDEFLAVAAHELRSPLNALGLQLAVLERELQRLGDARLIAQVGRARRNVDRYVRRAGALLDVSRLASGELEPVRAPVRQREVVEAVVETYADEAAFHGALLEYELQGDHVGLWDERMVEEILSNLVSNALRYGAGSPVRVRAGGQDGGTAWFSVADGGPGIDPAQRARIFEKFERVVPHSRDRGGFGLGLWITAGMVRAHQGEIEVRTPQAGGTEFVVRLPLHPEQASPEERRT